MKKFLLHAAIAAASITAANHASAAIASGVYITEWMYSGNGGEYVEFTNLTGSTIDFSGWSYDDDSQLPGVFDLSGFGVVLPGESVIITEDSESKFRSDWTLSSNVKVLGGYTNNLGRNDQINLFDQLGNLMDRLSYGDQTYAGTIRTQGISGRPDDVTALGANDVTQWIFSTAGDIDGAHYSLNGDLGSPGQYNPVPVPAAAWLLISGLMGLAGFARRKQR